MHSPAEYIVQLLFRDNFLKFQRWSLRNLLFLSYVAHYHEQVTLIYTGGEGEK